VVRAYELRFLLALGGAALAADREAPPDITILSTATTRSGVVALRAEGPQVVLIPRGKFTMGSDPDEVTAAAALCKAEPLGDDDCDKFFENEMEAH